MGVGGGPVNSKVHHLQNCIPNPIQLPPNKKVFPPSKHHNKCNTMCLYMCSIEMVTDCGQNTAKQIQVCFLLFIPLQRAPSLWWVDWELTGICNHLSCDTSLQNTKANHHLPQLHFIHFTDASATYFISTPFMFRAH